MYFYDCEKFSFMYYNEFILNVCNIYVMYNLYVYVFVWCYDVRYI